MMTSLLDAGVSLMDSIRSPQVMEETGRVSTIYYLSWIWIHMDLHTPFYSPRGTCF